MSRSDHVICFGSTPSEPLASAFTGLLADPAAIYENELKMTEDIRRPENVSVTMRYTEYESA